jgi:ubiquitin-conjugating enzyme E2 J2
VYDLKGCAFDGGVYFGYISLPENYPLKAPDFVFLTPNGRFKTNSKICTSFSAFHQDTFTSTWNIMTMMEGLISFMTDTNGGGVGSICATDDERRELALKSLDWNLNNETFMRIFPDFAEKLE